MPFHLHVFNLRENATSQEIHQMFSGLSLQSNGVTIIGGPKGEAFVTFDSESDLLQVLQRDGEQDLTFRIATDVEKERRINEFYMDIERGNYIDRDQRFAICGRADSAVGYSTPSKKQIVHLDESYAHGSDGYMQTRFIPTPKVQPPWISSSSMPRNVVEQHSTFKIPMDISNQRGMKRRRPENLQEKAGSLFNHDRYNHDRQWRSFDDTMQWSDGKSLIGRGYAEDGLDRCILPPKSARKQLQTEGPPLHSTWHQMGSDSSFYDNTLPAHAPHQFNERPKPSSKMTNFNYTPGLTQGPKSAHTPVSPKFKDSLLMSLLPQALQQRFCIQVSDLPPDVTPSMVWSWVGGSQGTALGAILLKPTNDYPVAFLIYNNAYDRDQRLRITSMKVVKFSAIDACSFITNFINNWTKWKGTRKLKSPIFETSDGIDWFIDPKHFHIFVENSERKKLMSVKKSKMPANSQGAKKPPVSKKTPKEPLEKAFLVVYQLEPTTTATEVQSWFSDAPKVLKLDFPAKDGPKNSEAMAFVIFANQENFASAQLGLATKGLLTGQRTGDVYKTISKYGEKCTIRETSSGGDHVVSLEERQKPPFLVQEKIQSLPNEHLFSLVSSMNMTFLYLKGTPPESGPKVIWNWYPSAKGVVIMRSRLNKTADAMIVFKTHADREAAVSKNLRMKKGGRAKWKVQRKFTHTRQAMMVLARFGYEMRLSTELRQPDRKITIEEVKFITGQMPVRKTAKSQVTTQVTPENPSFLHSLKGPCGPLEGESIYLQLFNVKENLTACQIHEFFPGALCALKVCDSSGSATGYVLLKDIPGREAAKLLYENYIGTLRSSQAANNEKLYQSLKRASVEESLSQICDKPVFESSPSGVDRLVKMEELAVKPPFVLVHDPPSLHYAKLTGYSENMSAGQIWRILGGCTSLVKGVVLLTGKTDPRECIACLAFDSMECYDKMIGTTVESFSEHWSLVLKMTESELISFLMDSCVDYAIKISTPFGSDRALNSAEEGLLGLPTKIKLNGKSTRGENREPADEQGDIHENITQNVKPRIGPTNIDDGFYIRLKRVPDEVLTASQLLDAYSSENGHCKSATLVKNGDDLKVSGYVRFDDVDHRDSALSRYEFSVRCTAYGRAVRIAELESEYVVLESTESGEDRVMTIEERAGLEELFNQQVVLSQCNQFQGHIQTTESIADAAGKPVVTGRKQNLLRRERATANKEQPCQSSSSIDSFNNSLDYGGTGN